MLELLTFINCNVCAVDWSQLAAFDILIAERFATLVGRQLAIFINGLNSNGYKFGRTTLIGHSLGAKVSSEAGLALHGKIGTIIGKTEEIKQIRDKFECLIYF